MLGWDGGSKREAEWSVLHSGERSGAMGREGREDRRSKAATKRMKQRRLQREGRCMDERELKESVDVMGRIARVDPCLTAAGLRAPLGRAGPTNHKTS